MKLQQLRYFCAACRMRSLSRAAESLHVSQPSVSMAIRELEREFGVSLIARRYQGFALTEEGTALWEMAQSLLRHADHMSSQMQALGQRRRPVRLGVPPMIGTASGFLLRPLACADASLAAISLSPPVSVQVSLVWRRSRKPFRDMARLMDLCRTAHLF